MSLLCLWIRLIALQISLHFAYIWACKSTTDTRRTANCALITPTLLSQSASYMALIICNGLFLTKKEVSLLRSWVVECLEAGEPLSWYPALQI